MTRYDERDAHTLVCMQWNRGVPDREQECVCPMTLPRTFRADYEVEGPYDGGPYPMLSRALFWIVCLAGGAAALWFLWALLRHINKV